jgi:hypothetical protein
MSNIRNENSEADDVSSNVITCHLPELEKPCPRHNVEPAPSIVPARKKRELLATDSGPDKGFRSVHSINTPTL